MTESPQTSLSCGKWLQVQFNYPWQLWPSSNVLLLNCSGLGAEGGSAQKQDCTCATSYYHSWAEGKNFQPQLCLQASTVPSHLSAQCSGKQLPSPLTKGSTLISLNGPKDVMKCPDSHLSKQSSWVEMWWVRRSYRWWPLKPAKRRHALTT